MEEIFRSYLDNCPLSAALSEIHSFLHAELDGKIIIDRSWLIEQSMGRDNHIVLSFIAKILGEDEKN